MLLAGTAFKKMLAMVSDTVQDVPAGLDEQVDPLLTVTPTNYQLASLHFLQKVRLSSLTQCCPARRRATNMG
jgi:hypothetical protein